MKSKKIIGAFALVALFILGASFISEDNGQPRYTLRHYNDQGELVFQKNMPESAVIDHLNDGHGDTVYCGGDWITEPCD